MSPIPIIFFSVTILLLAALLTWVLIRPKPAETGPVLEVMQRQIEALRVQVSESLRSSSSEINQRLDNAANLYGDLRRGRRPDFTAAAPPEVGRRLYDAFCGALRASDVRVETGRFGATMRLQIEGQTVTSLKHHAGRPDLDIERDDFSRCEGLHLIMAMVWTIR